MTIGRILALAFLAWPFLEIAAFIAVGRQIGILQTLLLIVVTSIVGGLLLRIQGISALRQVQRAVAGKGDPLRSIGHAALIGFGGLLLLLPGFVSDLFGVLLFLPPVRALILAGLARNADVVVVRTRARAGVVDLDRSEWRSDDPRHETDGTGRLPGPPDPDRR